MLGIAVKLGNIFLLASLGIATILLLNWILAWWEREHCWTCGKRLLPARYRLDARGKLWTWRPCPNHPMPSAFELEPLNYEREDKNQE